MKRANLFRGLIIMAIAAFFGYRYGQSGSVIYPIYLVVFAGAGLISLIGLLPARWQNMLLNLTISLFFLDFVFADINLAEVGEAFANANYWMLVPSTISILAHLFFRTLRSQVLLKPMGAVSFWPTFRALVIGITGNAVLPARAGEFLRAYVLGRSTGLAKTGVFATLVVERIIDGLTVILVLVAVMILGIRSPILQRAGMLGAILYGGVLLALVVFMAQRHWADTLVKKLLPENLAQFALNIVDGFTSGLAILKSPGHWGMVLLWNICTWIPIPISFWFALKAFDFGVTIPWQAPVLMLPAIALALTIPGAPAGVGLVQFSIKLTMDATFAQLPVAADFAEQVAAASIVIHLSQFGPEVIAGVISFVIEGLSTKDISTGTQMASNEVASGT
ncbi:MAG: flippase-like domain-containing protein [Anaerolineae bacterium]|nr:flippase-like domain-containing protein [Anaerolineae bacterium]